MNKDIKGLIKYLLFIFFVWLLPVGMFYCGLLSLSEHCSVYIVILALLLGLVLFIFYIILPVIFTYKAMKHHWSKYLDKFFYNKYAPTVLLIILVLLQVKVNVLHYGTIYFNSLLGILHFLLYVVEIFIAPTYYITYIILFILKKVKHL